MKNEEKMMKVNCSFCGKGMECPEGMIKKFEKHICFDCVQNPATEFPEDMTKVHVDIPSDEIEAIPEIITANISDKLFPEIWKERKNGLKQMPPEDMAREMFEEGVFSGISGFFYAMMKERKRELSKKDGM
ncbi:MAG: hypothetical protein GW780_03685 [Candidatus Aenigmarchaeota archaeon]